MYIEIRDLSMMYPGASQAALDGVSMELRHGTTGLLGPNGAGKTTLIKILSTQMLPTAGQVLVDGRDLQEQRAAVRRSFGYLPQNFGAYPDLTAWEFLDYMARLSHLNHRSERSERVHQALQEVGLMNEGDRRTGTFSGGMMRRLGIAQAILTEPDFLLVDEPTVGLDPEERIRFRRILGRLSENRAILISTHIVGDISSTCEDVAVLSGGRLLFHGHPDVLVRQAAGRTWNLYVDDAGFEALSRQFNVVGVAPEGDMLAVRVVGDQDPPTGAEPVEPSLEDAYVHFMGVDVDPTELEVAVVEEAGLA